LTLADLVVPGATLASEDGNFTFSGFRASVAGAISHDLSNYNVEARPSGFRIIGPFVVADGNVGDMLLSYTASGNNGIQITDVHLKSNAFFSPTPAPPGLAAAVNETITAGGMSKTIGVGATSQGFADPEASLVFADIAGFSPSYASVTVIKDISVSSSAVGLGSFAHISFVDQDFTYIPEPGTLLLASAGLLGLAGLGRKRSR
jgi:hypothetical protein